MHSIVIAVESMSIAIKPTFKMGIARSAGKRFGSVADMMGEKRREK
jgi:hypothetical protein